MTSTDPFPLEGGCDCRAVRYRMKTKPLFVHCCHCRWCQRETGASFALNAMIEADRVELLQGELDVVNTPSNSGKGQKIVRCARCRIAVWSHYAGAGDAVSFVREHRAPVLLRLTVPRLEGHSFQDTQTYKPEDQGDAGTLR